MPFNAYATYCYGVGSDTDEERKFSNTDTWPPEDHCLEEQVITAL